MKPVDVAVPGAGTAPASRFPARSIQVVGETHFRVTGFELATELLRGARLRPGVTGLADRETAEWARYPVFRLFEDMILFVGPPRHSVIRSRLHSWFTPAAAGELQALIDRVCDRILATVRTTAGLIDFAGTVAHVLPLEVISELIGIPARDRPKIAKRADMVVQAMWHTVTEVDRANGAAVLLDRYFRQLIAARRAAMAADLTSELVADGSLSDDEIVASLVFLVIAATFTTGDFLTSAMVMAVHNQEFRRRILDDETVAASVEEALRLHPPIAHIIRNAEERIELGSVVMPAGSLIDVDVAAVNRDPAQFPQPDEFRPDRVPNRSLSFSFGAHYCCGWALGRAEAETLLPKFLRAFPDIRLAGEPIPKRHPFQQGFRRVPLILREADVG